MKLNAESSMNNADRGYNYGRNVYKCQKGWMKLGKLENL